jgi:hypothetical protein
MNSRKQISVIPDRGAIQKRFLALLIRSPAVLIAETGSSDLIGIEV